MGIEEELCNIWKEVIGIGKGKVGIRDDFFRLGGDSIVSIQLVSRIRQELELEISIKDIFKYKTIESLFDNILGKRINKRLKIRREEGILEGEVKLLAIQEWFFNNKYVRQEHWNQSFLIKVSELDIDKLSEAVGKLVIWHDALRMRYEIIKENGSIRYMQYYTGKEHRKRRIKENK